MPRRREWRVLISLPVKVLAVFKGQHLTSAAHTCEVSERGARLSGVSIPLAPGQQITLKHGTTSALYRVVWVGVERTPSAGQVGLRRCAGEPYIWGIDLPADIDVDSGVDNHRDRRDSTRVESVGGVQCWRKGELLCLHGKVSNLSRGGCFIETKSPFAVGTIVRFQFIACGVKVRAEGEVRTTRPGEGMGVKFTGFVAPQDEQVLECLVNSLMTKEGGTPDSLLSQNDKLARELERWFRQKESLSREDYLGMLVTQRRLLNAPVQKS